MQNVRVEITINRHFQVDEKEFLALKELGIIPDIVNAQAPNQVKGWSIEGLTITDEEGQVIP